MMIFFTTLFWFFMIPLQAAYWTPEKILSLHQLSDVQLSGDNQWALFVATHPKGSTYETLIYKTRLQEDPSLAQPLLNISPAVRPRISPDGKSIAFLHTHQGVKHLYLTTSEGKEPIPITQGSKDVQTFAWSPCGRYIAFVREDEKKTEQNRDKKPISVIYEKDLCVNRLWLVDTSDPLFEATALTSDAYFVRGNGDYGTTVAEFDWSPDSKTLVFAYMPASGMDNFYLHSHLATVDVDSKKITEWPPLARYEATPRYSPDGKRVAYLADDSATFYALIRRIAIRSKEGLDPNLLAPTPNEGPFLTGTHLLGWNATGEALFFCEPQLTRFSIVSVPISGGKTTTLPLPDLLFKDLVLSQDRTLITGIAQGCSTPPEAACIAINSKNVRYLSSLNSDFKKAPLPRTEKIKWKTHDGLTIEGLLTYPIDYKKGKKYPLLLILHGGPMAFFDEHFVATPYPYPTVAFAENGFMVLKPNPRGSCGYGARFRQANYEDWGGEDFKDILAGIEMLKTKGLIDEKRLGIMGWSYGGYLTAWAISQTSIFRAASIGAGIANLVSLDGTSDLHSFMSDYLGPFTQKNDLYTKRSPLWHSGKVTTACLIQHGTEDKRVPVSQAYEFYYALKRANQNPCLVLYPNMGHRLSEPLPLLDAIQHNLNWFCTHLNK